jgi:hypothetical protein
MRDKVEFRRRGLAARVRENILAGVGGFDFYTLARQAPDHNGGHFLIQFLYMPSTGVVITA